MTVPEGKPWELLPPLRPEYLARIRKIAWDVQERVAAAIDWKNGENLWVAGCAAYSQRKFAFSVAAKAEYRDWLWAGFIEGQFVVRVLGVPIRMYRPPDDGDVPERYALPSEEESLISKGAYLLFDLPPSSLVWRLEVHTTTKARPVSVVLAQVDAHGRRFNRYEIPAPLEVVRDADVSPQATIKPRKRPIPMPETEVRSRKEQVAKPDDLEAEGPGA